MRRLLLLAALALFVIAWSPAPADAIFSLGCPDYDHTIAGVELALDDAEHKGAARHFDGRFYYFWYGVSENTELWLVPWPDVWEETNGIPGLQMAHERCNNCWETWPPAIECDHWVLY